MKAEIETMWRFMDGDLSVSEFESWVYGSETLKDVLGLDTHLEWLEADCSDSSRVFYMVAFALADLSPRRSSISIATSNKGAPDREVFEVRWTSKVLGFYVLEHGRPWCQRLQDVSVLRCGERSFRPSADSIGTARQLAEAVAPGFEEWHAEGLAGLLPVQLPLERLGRPLVDFDKELGEYIADRSVLEPLFRRMSSRLFLDYAG